MAQVVRHGLSRPTIPDTPAVSTEIHRWLAAPQDMGFRYTAFAQEFKSVGSKANPSCNARQSDSMWPSSVRTLPMDTRKI